MVKNKSFYFKLFAIVFLGMHFANGQEPAFGDEKAIGLAKKKALVKIIHKYKDGRSEEGTGTYIGDELIVTNYHVMRAYLNGEVKETKILDWQGGAATSISVGNCGGKNQDIDLCLLKVKGLNMQHAFRLYEREFRSSYEVTGYGYCMGRNDMTSWQGKVLKKIDNTGESVRDYGSNINRNTQTYEVSIKNCVGSSGGPVFDPMSGKLIALFSRYYYSKSYIGKDINEIMENAKYTVITSLEISEFMKSNVPYREIASEQINKERFLRDPFMP